MSGVNCLFDDALKSNYDLPAGNVYLAENATATIKSKIDSSKSLFDATCYNGTLQISKVIVNKSSRIGVDVIMRICLFSSILAV